MSRRYPQSFKDRAVRMVLERLEDEDAPARFTVIRQTAQKLSVSTEGLRRWVAGAEVDSGKKAGVSSDEQAEIRRLKRENAELRRANEILKTASAFFAAELDRPTTRDRGISICVGIVSGPVSICRTLGATERGFITSRGYRAAKTRAPSARDVRDAV